MRASITIEGRDQIAPTNSFLIAASKRCLDELRVGQLGKSQLADHVFEKDTPLTLAAAHVVGNITSSQAQTGTRDYPSHGS